MKKDYDLRSSEILNEEAQLQIVKTLKEFVDYFSEDHLRQGSHPRRFRNIMSVRRKMAGKILGYLEEGEISVFCVGEQGGYVYVGHRIDQLNEDVKVAIGVPINMMDPISLKLQVIKTDFLPQTISRYRQLRSLGMIRRNKNLRGKTA